MDASVHEEETFHEWQRMYRLAPNILAGLEPQDIGNLFGSSSTGAQPRNARLSDSSRLAS